jgi:hypothetical protein
MDVGTAIFRFHQVMERLGGRQGEERAYFRLCKRACHEDMGNLRKGERTLACNGCIRHGTQGYTPEYMDRYRLCRVTNAAGRIRRGGPPPGWVTTYCDNLFKKEKDATNETA